MPIASQQRYQPRHGDLALMILRQYEAAQLRGRNGRRCRAAAAATTVPPSGVAQRSPPDRRYGEGLQHQILDEVVLIALEARAGRRIDLDLRSSSITSFARVPPRRRSPDGSDGRARSPFPCRSV